MTTPNDGGSAYPVALEDFENGMTILDWFAGMAMQGIISNPRTSEDAAWEDISIISWQMADAMIKERES